VPGAEVPGAAAGEHRGSDEKTGGSTSQCRRTAGTRVLAAETPATTWSLCSFINLNVS